MIVTIACSSHTNILLSTHTFRFCHSTTSTYPLIKMSGGKKSTNLLVKVLLEGVYDEGCVLAKLKGCPHILDIIWRDVRRYWLAQIQLPSWNE